MNDPLRYIENSDPHGAVTAYDQLLAGGTSAWDVHRALFPVAQRALNLPFINPHLPKMHAIVGELRPYLEKADLPDLVRIEVHEYARRPKLDVGQTPGRGDTPLPFAVVEAAVEEGDPHALAVALWTYCRGRDRRDLARRLVLLGSGYVGSTIGHSVSCSAFMLQEMLAHDDREAWPALVALARYVAQGGFRSTPGLAPDRCPASEEALGEQALRAVSGTGFTDLHHTITLYAAERCRPWCSDTEASHVVGAAVELMGDKVAAPIPLSGFTREGRIPEDFDAFRQVFAAAEPPALLEAVLPCLGTADGRRRLGRHIIRAVTAAYQGNYDPHFLTGLGAALWVVERFQTRPDIQANAVLQFAGYFRRGLHKRG